MVKREHTDDELSEDDDSEKTAVNPTAKKAKPSPSPSKGKAKQPTPRKTPSTSQSSPVRQTPLISGSAKSRLGEMIIECGIKNYSKSEAQILTGLTPAQQTEMLKKDRGSLRRALMAAISDL